MGAMNDDTLRFEIVCIDSVDVIGIRRADSIRITVRSEEMGRPDVCASSGQKSGH